ncbi:MAG: hypothetical protein A2V66_11850, partial [Ignavibacteria bacterium RBG_13_36_8]
TYQPPKEYDIQVYENIREMAKRFGLFILDHCPNCQETNEAIIKLREMVMWINAAIALREGKEDVK